MLSNNPVTDHGKYSIKNDLSSSYDQYLDDEIEDLFTKFKYKISIAEKSDKKDAYLFDLFKNTKYKIIAVHGLELGFLEAVLLNENMRYSLSLEVFATVKRSDLSTLSDIRAINTAIVKHLMYPGSFVIISLIKQIMSIQEEKARNRWKIPLYMRVRYYEHMISERPSKISSMFFVSLINQKDASSFTRLFSNTYFFKKFFEDNREEIEELYIGTENENIPIEIMIGCSGIEL